MNSVLLEIIQPLIPLITRFVLRPILFLNYLRKNIDIPDLVVQRVGTSWIIFTGCTKNPNKQMLHIRQCI